MTLAIALAAPRSGEPEPAIAGVRLFYGPSPQTAGTDLSILAGARKSIDMAAFVLTDRDVLGALADAARRGVAIRIYLDRDEMDHAGNRGADALSALAAVKTVAIRFKARHSESMHLKSYVVDRRLLRTGSANFSYSGERYQDNDVVLVENPALAAAFLQTFETMWTRPDNAGLTP
ncbi:MAG: phosphatidylserine synthase [Hyphomicrobiales bacterium]|nr:phosphatidylserine synthase [Hyphomicrobiales bacterium]